MTQKVGASVYLTVARQLLLDDWKAKRKVWKEPQFFVSLCLATESSKYFLSETDRIFGNMGVEGTMHIPVSFSTTLFITLQYLAFFYSDGPKCTLLFPIKFTKRCLPLSNVGNDFLVTSALGLI